MKRPRRTQRQKLLDAVSESRACWLDSGRDRRDSGDVRSLYPSRTQELLFLPYSQALRALVAHHLAAPGWGIATDDDGSSSWSWDDHETHFYFEYEAFAELPFTTEDKLSGRSPRMRCVAHLTFDPERPIQEELARLIGEAKHYRSAVALLEREVFRNCVQAERAQETA